MHQPLCAVVLAAGQGTRMKSDLPKGSLFVKNETLQLLGSHKSRHLAGAIMHLETLRAYGQKDPLNEYKREAFFLFRDMLGNMREQVTRLLMHIELAPQTGGFSLS